MKYSLYAFIASDLRYKLTRFDQPSQWLFAKCKKIINATYASKKLYLKA